MKKNLVPILSILFTTIFIGCPGIKELPRYEDPERKISANWSDYEGTWTYMTRIFSPSPTYKVTFFNDTTYRICHLSLPLFIMPNTQSSFIVVGKCEIINGIVYLKTIDNFKYNEMMNHSWYEIDGEVLKGYYFTEIEYDKNTSYLKNDFTKKIWEIDYKYNGMNYVMKTYFFDDNTFKIEDINKDDNTKTIETGKWEFSSSGYAKIVENEKYINYYFEINYDKDMLFVFYWNGNYEYLYCLED